MNIYNKNPKMNYKKIYDEICERAKSELEGRKAKKKLGNYYEGHHIVPKCLGGEGWATQYNHSNIVLLTAREHFLCHWLLHEMHPENYKLAKAFSMLCNVKDPNQIRYIPSSRIVEYAKIKSSILHSNYMKNEFWSEDMKSHMSKVHTGKKHSEDIKRVISARIKESITDESRIARSIRTRGDNNPSKKEHVRQKMKERAKARERIQCPHCEKDGPTNQMKQWHFNNCKFKKEIL